MLMLAKRAMACATVALVAVSAYGAEPPALATPRDKTSYSIGVDVARNFKRLDMDINLPVLLKGISDVFTGEKLLMDDEEIRMSSNLYLAELRRRQAKATFIAGDVNRKAGEAFLAENKKKEGVVTLPSGLQYRILKAGDGKKPTDTDFVECSYRGTQLNGTEFDSTRLRGKPSTFQVNSVIPGWREALKLMPVGSKWQIVIPSHLGYGARRASQSIAPNATLIFDVELLAIKPPDAVKTASPAKTVSPAKTASPAKTPAVSKTQP